LHVFSRNAASLFREVTPLSLFSEMAILRASLLVAAALLATLSIATASPVPGDTLPTQGLTGDGE
jgi:hypothetical protein